VPFFWADSFPQGAKIQAVILDRPDILIAEYKLLSKYVYWTGCVHFSVIIGRVKDEKAGKGSLDRFRDMCAQVTVMDIRLSVIVSVR